MSSSSYEFFLASSLEKVFPAVRPAVLPEHSRLSAWCGTRAAVQLCYRVEKTVPTVVRQAFRVEISGAPCDASLRRVELLPSDFPVTTFPENEGGLPDEFYITTEPGMFPDLLKPADNRIVPLPGQYRSLWLSWEIPADAEPGDYEVRIRIHAEDDPKHFNCIPAGECSVKNQVWELSVTLSVGKTRLDPQRLIHTEWFHADCLSSYYHVPMFGEEHWRILENFIRAAGREHGINMLLTPVFTPPLDTAVGGERPTTQLVDITRSSGVYSFGFQKLARWCEICRRCGIEYIEIAHLFSQWGAVSVPKIMATVDGAGTQLFGWGTAATDPAYRVFLEAFLPALCAFLKTQGYDNRHVYFHISDEPSMAQLESYRAAREMVADLLEGYPIIDALSSIEFYKQGLIAHPVPGNDHMEAFVEAGVPDLWTYYCVAQCHLVPNRFYCMPSARNRIMGVLMYLYRIRGFLQWGYNFYYSQYSVRLIDPYRETHAGYAFSSGDAYLVYPGENGEALSSIRAEVQDDALLDLRALQTLESRVGEAAVRELIFRVAETDHISFTDYPRDPAFLLELREAVARELALLS